ncbi:GNAT family N-acetyltransferase [Rufibacter soli]
MKINIRHDQQDQQFTACLNEDEIGELAYALPEPQVIDFQHTFIEEEHRGKGVADQLIKHGLDYAQQQKLEVRATCTAVARYLEKNPL